MRAQYDLSFFDGDNEYETITGGPSVYLQGLPPGDEEGRRSHVSGTANLRREGRGAAPVQSPARVPSVGITDEEFTREFPYERLLELDTAVQDRGGLHPDELSRCLRRRGEAAHRDDAEQCSICLEALSEANDSIEVVGCRHAFHRGCAEEWFTAHHTCPLCRSNLREL